MRGKRAAWRNLPAPSRRGRGLPMAAAGDGPGGGARQAATPDTPRTAASRASRSVRVMRQSEGQHRVVAAGRGGKIKELSIRIPDQQAPGSEARFRRWASRAGCGRGPRSWPATGPVRAGAWALERASACQRGRYASSTSVAGTAAGSEATGIRQPAARTASGCGGRWERHGHAPLPRHPRLLRNPTGPPGASGRPLRKQVRIHGAAPRRRGLHASPPGHALRLRYSAGAGSGPAVPGAPAGTARAPASRRTST